MLNFEFDGTNTDRKWPNGNYLFALVAHPSGPKRAARYGSGLEAHSVKRPAQSVFGLFALHFHCSRTLAHRAHATRRALPGTASFPSPDSPVERSRPSCSR